jgi:hypothetical protein
VPDVDLPTPTTVVHHVGPRVVTVDRPCGADGRGSCDPLRGADDDPTGGVIVMEVVPVEDRGGG